MTSKALELADSRPQSLDDDLYSWAIEAECELRRLHAAKRHWMQIADQRAVEVAELKVELRRLAAFEAAVKGLEPAGYLHRNGAHAMEAGERNRAASRSIDNGLKAFATACDTPLYAIPKELLE